MSLAKTFVIYVAALFCILVITNLIVWNIKSNEIARVCTLERCQKYSVHSRQYTFPDLPHHKSSGTPYLLDVEFLFDERLLLKRIINMFDVMQVKVWPSGGTLLGLVRHGTILPWDDDCDLHTSNENIPLLFSQSFLDICRTFDLQILVISAVDKKKAITREGGGIRLRRRNTSMPVCDIFFVGTLCHPLTSTSFEEVKASQRRRHKHFKDTRPHNKVAKIDTWSGGDFRFTANFNNQEIWNIADVFPLQRREFDDISMWMPRNPEALLKKQYSDKCLEEIFVRNIMISHTYPFTDMDFVFKKL